ncbi:MAG: hypothetical protein QXG12_04320 [Thermoproteota archaeon]
MVEVKVLQEDLYAVSSPTNHSIWYVVDLLRNIRACKGFAYRGYCKHLKVLKRFKSIS